MRAAALVPASRAPNSAMSVELDHIFLATDVDAPVAERLHAAGFAEGPPNVHPGQGTACRRFFFRNAYLELLWVRDAGEARGAATAPTRLWERWAGRAEGLVCPVGVATRPAPGTAAPDEAPFASWPYRPAYLPPGLAIPVGANVDVLDEPMLFHLPFGRRPDSAAPAVPLAHGAGVREVTRLSLALARAAEPSAELAALVRAGVVELGAGERPLVELGFDGERAGAALDLRPAAPLVLRW